MNAPRASLVVLLALAPALASAADPHVDPVASVVLHLALILVVARAEEPDVTEHHARQELTEHGWLPGPRRDLPAQLGDDQDER